MNLNIYKVELKFKVNKKPKQFNVYTNLPNEFGMSIVDAFNSWLARTDSYTDKSFCEYVMSKTEQFVCMTENQYINLNKLGN